MAGLINVRKSTLDFIRIGTYSQVEGSFRYHGNLGFRFTFFLQQIPDIEELIRRVVDAPPRTQNTYIQFYSKELYESLKELGFERFRADNWNVPKVVYQSPDNKKEYIRALIDALGNVDVDTYRNDNTAYVKVTSVNKPALEKVGGIFAGHYYTWKDRGILQWKGRDALEMVSYLDGKFYNNRNQRGAEIIERIKWANYI